MFRLTAWWFCTIYSVIACDSGNYSLLDKTVIVTGAAKGIGYAIADNFLAEGVKTIIIVDKNFTYGMLAEKKLNNKYGCDKVAFYPCHVFRDVHCWDQIKSVYKQIDILVNNAGIVGEYDTTEMILTNVAAVIQWSFKFRDYCRTDRNGPGGTIINISSTGGYSITPFMSTYSATKRAISGFTEDFGHDYNCKRNGVRVLGICPDLTDTDLIKEQMVEDDQVEILKKFKAVSSLQSADNVGKAVVVVYKTAGTGTLWTVSRDELYQSPATAYCSTEFLESL